MQIKYGREKDYADFSHKQNQTADGRAIVQFMEVWSGMMECAAEQSGADLSETACLTVQAAADAAGISRDEDVLAGAVKLLDCWAYGDQLREWIMYHPPDILSERPDVASILWYASQELLDAVPNWWTPIRASWKPPRTSWKSIGWPPRLSRKRRAPQ